jgi:hypothetical protein
MLIYLEPNKLIQMIYDQQLWACEHGVGFMFPETGLLGLLGLLLLGLLGFFHQRSLDPLIRVGLLGLLVV